MKQPQKLIHFKDKHLKKIGVIIGGGPSIKTLLDQQYPFNKLNEYITIGTNVSYTIIDSNYLLFMDRYFWHTFYKDVEKLNNTIKVTQIEKEFNNKLKRPLPFDFIHVPTKGVYFPLIKTGKDDIKCNNTGSFALSFAYLLGLDEIYLFGIDMCINSDNQKNFHNKYINKTKPIKIVNGNINNHYLNIGKIIGVLTEKYNIKIYSCSNISKLNKFIPYVNPKTLI